MWQVSAITSRRVRLDASTSGQSPLEATRVELDGIRFANAAERTSWDEEIFQVEICEQCGIEGCSPGGWLACKRAGDYVMLVPAFDRMLEGEAVDFAPPKLVGARGVPLLGRVAYERDLRSVIPSLPVLDRLLPLRHADVLRLLQLEAPHALLGTFPAVPSVRRDADWLAVSAGELDDWLERLTKAIQDTPPETAIVLERLGESDVPVDFYIDTPIGSEWRPLAVSAAGEVCLLLAPDFACRRRSP
jgi:hypothetical protein